MPRQRWREDSPPCVFTGPRQQAKTHLEGSRVTRRGHVLVSSRAETDPGESQQSPSPLALVFPEGLADGGNWPGCQMSSHEAWEALQPEVYPGSRFPAPHEKPKAPLQPVCSTQSH